MGKSFLFLFRTQLKMMLLMLALCLLATNAVGPDEILFSKAKLKKVKPGHWLMLKQLDLYRDIFIPCEIISATGDLEWYHVNMNDSTNREGKELNPLLLQTKEENGFYKFQCEDSLYQVVGYSKKEVAQ